MVALDADGAVVRDALLWNDTRSAQAAADLIAELGDGDPAAGAKAWAGRDRLGAGGLVHRDQAALAARPRARAGREGRRGRPAARLADLAPGRLRPGRRGREPRPVRPDHRPLGRVRHGVLVGRDRRVPARARGARARPRGRPAARARPGRGRSARVEARQPGRRPAAVRRCRRQRRSRARPRHGAGRRRGLDRHLRRGLGDQPARHRRRQRHGHRLRRRDRRLPAAGLHAERLARAGRRVPPARRGPPRAVGARAVRTRGRGRPGAGALPGGRAHAQQAERDGRAARPAAGQHHSRAPGAGRRRGHALCARRRAGRAARAGRAGRAHPADRRRCPVRGGPARSRRRCSASTCWFPRRASTSPTVRPARPPGCSPARRTRRASAPAWRLAGEELRTAVSTPQVRARYAEVRDMVADRPA